MTEVVAVRVISFVIVVLVTIALTVVAFEGGPAPRRERATTGIRRGRPGCQDVAPPTPDGEDRGPRGDRNRFALRAQWTMVRP